MKIFTGAQIKELDKYTVEHEPIKSEDLMERAAGALTRAITASWDKDTAVVVFAGPGTPRKCRRQKRIRSVPSHTRELK